MIRILLVGYGRMARLSHIPEIGAFGEAELVGIVRRTTEPCGTIPVFQDLRRAVAELNPDLAVISTPHVFHYEQALTCIEGGCHVLVDKPLTLNLSQSTYLVSVAEARDRLLVVGVQRRYEGFASTFKYLLQQKRIDKPILIHGIFAHRFADEQPPWLSEEAVAGAGIIDDSGWHLVDLLVFLSDSRVAEIKASVLCEQERRPHSFTAFARCENDTTLVATASYLSPRNSVQEEISIFASEASLFARRFCLDWDNKPPRVWFKSSDARLEEEVDVGRLPCGRQLPLRALITYLLGRGARSDILSEAASVLETQRVIDMIRVNWVGK